MLQFVYKIINYTEQIISQYFNEEKGFGKYNYGLDKDSVRGKEKGLYRYTFKIPETWKGKLINLVFF